MAVPALGMMLATLLFSGCYVSSDIYTQPAHNLRGKNMLVLPAGTPEGVPRELQEEMLAKVETALKGSPWLGNVITREDFPSHPGHTPKIGSDYNLYASTLALTDMPSPEEGYRLAKALDIQLLTSIQISYVACPTCEEGNQLWFTGAVFDGMEGDVVFRVYYQIPIDGPEEAREAAEEATEDYLDDLMAAFSPKWHRERFEALRAGEKKKG